MSIHSCRMLAGIAVLLALAWASPTHALTIQECSAKYKASQAAGTLKGMSWNQFRKAECGANAAAAPAAPASATTVGRAPAANEPSGNVVFPSAVSGKYASESAGKARMHTCLDQYNANKTRNGNGSLKWIQKGGGYYSECNRRLSQR
jgi:hypothetical protein